MHVFQNSNSQAQKFWRKGPNNTPKLILCPSAMFLNIINNILFHNICCLKNFVTIILFKKFKYVKMLFDVINMLKLIWYSNQNKNINVICWVYRIQREGTKIVYKTNNKIKYTNITVLYYVALLHILISYLYLENYIFKQKITVIYSIQ